MLISSREKEISMVVIILSQPENFSHNKTTLSEIIDKLINNVTFQEQNKVLIQIKLEIMKKELNFKNIKRLSNEFLSCPRCAFIEV